jgi:uncharacterized protein YbjT (DUF2867 family)
MLATRGEPVRTMTRRPESATFPDGVEVVPGDFENPASLDAALRGVDRVFVMSAQAIGSASGPTHDWAMAQACRKAGVRRVVKLSALGGGGDDLRSPIARWMHEGEAAVRETGAEWTLLRPGRFMTNVLAWAPMIRRGDEVSIPLAHRPTASIDPADVATLACLALTERGHAGKTYELSGPEVLTPIDEVRILGEALGRPLRVNALPIAAAREGMLRYGMPEQVVDAALAQVDTDRGSHVLPTVEEVTGRPARKFADWVRSNLHAFT